MAELGREASALRAENEGLSRRWEEAAAGAAAGAEAAAAVRAAAAAEVAESAALLAATEAAAEAMGRLLAGRRDAAAVKAEAGEEAEEEAAPAPPSSLTDDEAEALLAAVDALQADLQAEARVRPGGGGRGARASRQHAARPAFCFVCCRLSPTSPSLTAGSNSGHQLGLPPAPTLPPFLSLTSFRRRPRRAPRRPRPASPP